jgi:3-oxoacyl-[acyl-carrier protein] reductase
VRERQVLVTGASRGIGAAIARRLAAADYGVALSCRSGVAAAEAVAEAIRSAGGEARVLVADVAEREGLRRALAADMERHGTYYGVVCNAGIARDAAFPMMSDADWDDVLRTNLGGFYNVLSAVVTPMIRRRAPGRIVAITSVSGLMGNRGQANYSASKAGIMAAARSLAVELAKRRITVNCVAPGLIDTDMTRELPMRDEMIKAIPAGRAGTPEEVASMVAFLMSDEAAYVTRQVIAVNGGLC